jgi:hypothetical protein
MSKIIMPWSVKGVSKEARNLAKAKAQAEGMTIGDWLTKLILDNDNSTTASDKSAMHPDLPKLILAVASRVSALEKQNAYIAQIDQRLLTIEEKLLDSSNPHESVKKA